MDDLVFFGARLLLEIVKQSVEAETRRNEEAHQRAIIDALYRERLRVQARNDARIRERRAAIERLRLASPDPQWQQRIDQMLQAMAGR